MLNIEDIVRPIALDFRTYEDAFAHSLQSDNPLLHEVLQWTTANRGKQLRPILLLLSAQICNRRGMGINDKTIQSAVSLELMHTASLIHDDIVDSSDRRRGKESVWKHWNQKVAVLSGDYILSRAMHIVGNLRNVQILNIVLDLASSLSSGELLQLNYAGENMFLTEDEAMRIIEKKTASLFSACAEIGAVSVGATMKQQTALREYGRHLGICFQLKDDIFDYSESEEIGKPTMGDVCDGKLTLPLIVSLQRATRVDRELMYDILLQPLGDDELQAIKSFVLRYDGIGYTQRKMHEHYESGMSCLQVFREGKLRSSLEDLLRYAVVRTN